MSQSIGTTRVDEIMISDVVTVRVNDKIEDVAQVFYENDINAAPVVDQEGRCVGIITSHDVVEYETSRIEVNQEIQHGYYFNLAHYGETDPPRMSGVYYDEAGCHMSRTLITVSPDDPLSKVAQLMCGEHIHHMIVLDGNQQVVGLLSSLDILGQIMGVPVCRKPKLKP